MDNIPQGVRLGTLRAAIQEAAIEDQISFSEEARQLLRLGLARRAYMRAVVASADKAGDGSMEAREIAATLAEALRDLERVAVEAEIEKCRAEGRA